MFEITATALELAFSRNTTCKLECCGGTPGMTHHRNSLCVQASALQQTAGLDGIEQSRDIQGTQTQFLRTWGRPITGQHRLLLTEITAGVVRQKHGVTLRRQHLAPSFKRFRVIPEAMGNHYQTPVG